MLKILLLLSAPAFALAHTTVGTAFVENKEAYKESHKIEYSNPDSSSSSNLSSKSNLDPSSGLGPSKIVKIKTTYTSKGKKIGHRLQEFTDNHYIPNLVFKDDVNGETYSITVKGKEAVLQTYFDEQIKTKTFKVKIDQVTTASLAKYILDNFDSLLEDSKVVDCLIPRSLRFVSLKITKSKVNNNSVTFAIQPASMLLKLFFSKTLVTFNKNTKDWVKYEGPSNLKNKQEKLPRVKITYQTSST